MSARQRRRGPVAKFASGGAVAAACAGHRQNINSSNCTGGWWGFRPDGPSARCACGGVFIMHPERSQVRGRPDTRHRGRPDIAGLCMAAKCTPSVSLCVPNSVAFMSSHTGPAARRQLAAKHAYDGRVIVWTIANMPYLDFAVNWAFHVERAGLRGSYMVGCMDDELLQDLAQRGVPVFALSAAGLGAHLRWGSPQFQKRVGKDARKKKRHQESMNV
jgi:hypothetical protein